MEQGMDTCSWACHNTFTSFYLSEEMNDGYRIGHIVANQKVVSLLVVCIYSPRDRSNLFVLNRQKVGWQLLK